MAVRPKKIEDGQDTGKPRGVRQERARQRRRHLSEVVMQLIQERGFDAISVNEVAERASMSIGGLYRHISTKSDLLEMVCDEINLDLLEEMKAAAGKVQGVPAKLDAAIRVYWLRHWDSSASILVAYREYQSFSETAKKRYRSEEHHLAEYFSDLIRAGVAVDEFRAVDDRLLAHEIILLSHMRALKGYAFRDRPRDAILAEQLDLIFSRLRPLPSS
ncbi:TetR/AcrR family transcriptional regulator [Novosphingobium lentum]|uniref:TetR/AcrR family transcriptional regulator n=1 Tax=Novosphingobium lentum TaxID=145287 RepID=UPI000832E6A4|nr:TetR/AcrR family transcriptional regulator [Novosphingobium lentum]